jgi:hypothetical protein
LLISAVQHLSFYREFVELLLICGEAAPDLIESISGGAVVEEKGAGRVPLVTAMFVDQDCKEAVRQSESLGLQLE